MREKQEVLDRFRELRDKYLKEFKASRLGRSPVNCSHNAKLNVKDRGRIGFCQNQIVLAKYSKNKIFVCNDCETASRCNLFSCRNTDDGVVQEFKDILSSPARCGSAYPKLAMLIWFLQEFDTRKRGVRFVQLWKKLGTDIKNILLFRWW